MTSTRTAPTPPLAPNLSGGVSCLILLTAATANSPTLAPNGSVWGHNLYLLLVDTYHKYIDYNTYFSKQNHSIPAGSPRVLSKPGETRDKPRTRTPMGMVFTGTGTGTGNFTRGLPVSHPNSSSVYPR